MSNNFEPILVKDMLPKDIIQKGYQYDSIEDIIKFENINSRDKFIEYLLYLDFYRRKNIKIDDFYINLNREKFNGTIKDFYNSLTNEELCNLKKQS